MITAVLKSGEKSGMSIYRGITVEPRGFGDIITSMYAHNSAAVRTSQGLSEIFRCLMGVKQGCDLSPTQFGLYVDGLEKHLLETAGNDAPELCGILVRLLLYADDVILMSTSPRKLQRQLDALASFFNLSKTKSVIFEARKSECKEFVLNGTTIEQHDEYRYLGVVFHATKNKAYRFKYLMAAAKNAVRAMRRHCISLHLSDPATICKLFDFLVLPILSYM
ncbi:MAG: reverse transcriptase [Trebouxia sp. A1-2]|nr:MAG: reverse transcriptase [Trebouxia sp. A1-2]